MLLPERKSMNKGLYTGIAVGLIMMCTLSGCRGCRKDTEVYNENRRNEDSISVSNNVPSEDGQIMVSLAGYEKNGAKKALIKCSGNSKRFSVIDKETEKEALSGRIQFGVKQTNVSEEGGICDFTSLDKAGSFYIRTDSGICSEEFTIKEGLYSDLLKEKTAYSSETTIKKEEINKDNIENCFLYITDVVLSEEFFGEHTIKNGKDINSKLPESIKTVKIQTDALSELINEHGVLDMGLRAGNETYYQYSAVMSLFAYEYGPYDKEEAGEYTKLAEASYRHAEEIYEKASVEEKKEVDDKRFWAAAQLYKLTGERNYKKTAESYAGDPPTGFSKDKSGYLGTIAYLTCYNKIDLDVGEMFITALMKDINGVIRNESVNTFLISREEDHKDENISAAFEAARLMVLGNYITKNIYYVETAESYVEYLFGINMLGKDYAYDASSDNYSEPMSFILAGLIESYIYEDRQPEAMSR